jgi:succinate dehydrogenase / fumarate reductase, cytochrome b subunit
MNQSSNLRRLGESWDPRARRPGSWAFLLNRLSALGLTVYLGLHLAVLSKLAQGPPAYDGFLTFAQLPVLKMGELILIAAALFHGLNGVRLGLHAFGVGVRAQKLTFAVVIGLTLLAMALFAARLLAG